MPAAAECGVVLLAGGRSRRMGHPKAWLEFDGLPLLAHLVARMQADFPEVVVVAAPGQELPPTPARVVYDEHPGAGPLAGLEVGLREVKSPLAFVCSCDAPFLNPRVAAYLAGRAEACDAVVPEWEGRLQPLHAVYRTAMQPLLAAQLGSGHRRVLDLFDQVRTRVVPADELRALDPTGRSFLNMNSPEDYSKALRLWHQQTP